MSEARRNRLTILLTEAERQEIEDAARRDERSVSGWCRVALAKEAKYAAEAWASKQRMR